MVMVTVVMVSSCRGNPICRPGADQVETRQGVGPTWTHPLPGLHLVYTCSAPGLQIGFRQLLTITAVTITIALIVVITIIITKITCQMHFAIGFIKCI